MLGAWVLDSLEGCRCQNMISLRTTERWSRKEWCLHSSMPPPQRSRLLLDRTLMVMHDLKADFQPASLLLAIKNDVLPHPILLGRAPK